jgi:hypothetical protein
MDVNGDEWLMLNDGAWWFLMDVELPFGSQTSLEWENHLYMGANGKVAMFDYQRKHPIIWE